MTYLAIPQKLTYDKSMNSYISPLRHINFKWYFNTEMKRAKKMLQTFSLIFLLVLKKVFI